MLVLAVLTDSVFCIFQLEEMVARRDEDSKRRETLHEEESKRRETLREEEFAKVVSNRWLKSDGDDSQDFKTLLLCVCRFVSEMPWR